MREKLCRLLGQQTLVGFIGLHIDIKAVRADNDKKDGKRKKGLLVNSVEKLTRAQVDALKVVNQMRYGLSD